MGMFICYYCGNEPTDCPVCWNMDDRQPTCTNCSATGFLCEEHGTDWMGSVWCPPEHEVIIDEWIHEGMNELDRGEGLTVASLPYRGEDELSYIVFICDLNASRPAFNLTHTGLCKQAWLKRCRDLAVDAGGRVPQYLRAGPLPGVVPDTDSTAVPQTTATQASVSAVASALPTKRRWWQH